MIDKRLLYFTIIIFVIINGYVIAENLSFKSQSFQIDQNSELIIFKSLGDHDIQVTINILSLDGSASIKYFDWDVWAQGPIHVGINTFTVTTDYFSIISSGSNSPLIGTFLVRDTGPDLGFGAFLLGPLTFFTLIGAIIIFNYIPRIDDIKKLSKFMFFSYNLSIFLPIPSEITYLPFIFKILFGLIQFNADILVYLLILIYSNILFLVSITGRYTKKFNHIMSKLLLILGFATLFYSSIIFSYTIFGFIIGVINTFNVFLDLTAFYLLIVGLVICTKCIEWNDLKEFLKPKLDNNHLSSL